MELITSGKIHSKSVSRARFVKYNAFTYTYNKSKNITAVTARKACVMLLISRASSGTRRKIMRVRAILVNLNTRNTRSEPVAPSVSASLP
eukprot:1116863-Amphidinium_carterae.1